MQPIRTLCEKIFCPYLTSFDEEEFEDPQRVIRIRKSKDSQQNGQKKRTNNDLQKMHIKVTRTPLRTMGEPRFSGRVSSSCFTSTCKFNKL